MIYLQKSRIGMSTNVLRKKSQSPEVTVIAKKLIKSWKKLLPSLSVSVYVLECITVSD